MWKKVNIEGNDYLINHFAEKTTHKILITNFINLWLEEIQENILITRCKEMNKLIEANNDVLLGHVLSLVEREKDCVVRTFSSSSSHDDKVLNLHTSLEGFKFKMKFNLKKASCIQFYEEVTLQLLTTISEMEKRNNLLSDLIKRKDMEIMEYKLEGGRISRKAVETEPFDLQDFSTNCDKDLSTTKSQVKTQPSDTLTPLLQDLLNKISTAPVLEPPKNEVLEVENPTNESKMTVVKMRSPSKHKKLKMYEDDDDDDDKTEEKVVRSGENKDVRVKQESEVTNNPPKGKLKTKRNKGLLNL